MAQLSTGPLKPSASGRLALDERVRPGRRRADGEVVPALLRPAALEEGQLARR